MLENNKGDSKKNILKNRVQSCRDSHRLRSRQAAADKGGVYESQYEDHSNQSAGDENQHVGEGRTGISDHPANKIYKVDAETSKTEVAKIS